MLSALRLGNFKAFAASQRCPIRPLTLIFGPNSGGKSSLLHGLLFARHALETQELDAFRTAIGGEAVDLGGFRQFVYRREAARWLEWGVDLDVSGLTGRLAELLAPVRQVGLTLTIGVSLDDQGQPVRDAGPVVMTYELLADGETLLRLSRRPDGLLRLDRLEREHPVFREVLKAIVETATTTPALSPEDYAGMFAAIDALVPEIAVHGDGLLPAGLARLEQPLVPGEQLLWFPISRGNRQEDLANAVRLFLPRTLDDLIRGVNQALTGTLERLRYLGPLRSYPPRHLVFAQHYDPNWFAGGGYAWDEVRRNVQVRNAVNKWLGDAGRLQTPYQLVIREMVDLEQLERPLFEGLERLSEWGLDIEHVPEVVDQERDEVYGGEIIPFVKDPEQAATDLKVVISESEIDRLHELILIDRRSETVVSHRDIGIGVSQVLPVLVGAYAYDHKIIAIEQPEIHLHPRLQAELGDVFIESALGERRNTFLLETHSEHLILRLMRRMRDTVRGKLPEGLPAVRPEDVSILYVQPKDAAAVVRVLELDSEGKLLDAWPGGFFEEGFHERFS
jgi:hypothetical protein